MRNICNCCSASVLLTSCQVKMLIGSHCMDLQHTTGEIVYFLFVFVCFLFPSGSILVILVNYTQNH